MAATSLAAQLAALQQQQQGQPAQAKRSRGKPSLLFDPQKAADVDVATLYQVGCCGGSRAAAAAPPGPVPPPIGPPRRRSLFAAGGEGDGAAPAARQGVW
jgi:hypothetical protein